MSFVLVLPEEEAYDNPCTLEALESGENMFPYPYDPSKFILCDFRGKPYITKCPDRFVRVFEN